MKKTICMMVTVVAVILSCLPVFAIESDTDVVKGVQSTLNIWGYDCGTPDGVIGSKTKAAVAEYQEKQGLEPTGEITEELVERMISGVPYDVFEKRYNEVISYFTKHPELTTATNLQWIKMNSADEHYQANRNLSLDINPNYSDKKMIGIVNLYGVDGEYKNDLATIEFMATFYAFDPAYRTIDESIDAAYETLSTVGETTSHDIITYDNYSFDHNLFLKGEFVNFRESSVAKQSVISADEGQEEPVETEEDKDTVEENTKVQNSVDNTGDVVAEETVDEDKDATDIHGEKEGGKFGSTNKLIIDHLEELEEYTDFLESPKDVVEKYADLDIDFSKPYEEHKEYGTEFYGVDGSFIGYDGDYSFGFKDGKLTHITFHPRNKEPIEANAFIELVTDFLGKQYSTNNLSEGGSDTCLWKLSDYEVDICYYSLDESENFQGVQFISFGK